MSRTPQPPRWRSPKLGLTAILVGGVLTVAACSDGPIAAPDQRLDSGLLTATATNPLLVEGDQEIINGALFELKAVGEAGTGQFTPYVRLDKAGGITFGHNSSGRKLLNHENASTTWTTDLLLSEIPVIEVDGVLYYEFLLDIQEPNNGDFICGTAGANATCVSLDDFQLYADGMGGNLETDPTQLGDFIWGMDDGLDTQITFTDLNNGQSVSDLQVLVPASYFEAVIDPADLAECSFGSTTCETYIYHWSEFGATVEMDASFAEWGVREGPIGTVTKTANTSVDAVNTWKITKKVSDDDESMVDAASISMFTGDEADVLWHITTDVTGTGEYTNPMVDGVITFTVDREVMLESVIDDLTGDFAGAGDDATIGECRLNGTPIAGDIGDVTMDEDDTLECDYSGDFPGGDVPDGSETFTNWATVKLDLGDGTFMIFRGSEDYDFSDPDVNTVLNPSVDVTDPRLEDLFGAGNIDLTGFTDGETRSFVERFACDEDEGDHVNVASLVAGTPVQDPADASDDAQVSIECLELTVTKTVDERLTREYLWDITKEVWDPQDPNDPNDGVWLDAPAASPFEIMLAEGQAYTIDYRITLDVTGTDEYDYGISGTVTVANNTALSATINSVSDVLDDGTAVSLTCEGVVFPKTLGPGESFECTYDEELGDDLPAATKNTATATQQNYISDVDETADPPTWSPVAGGTTDWSGMAAINWAEAVVTKVNECVTVSDVNGFSGPTSFADNEACAGDAPKSFTYSIDIVGGTSPFVCDVTHRIVNTATINETGANDDANVDVTTECIPDTCTLTRGYWQTHNDWFRQMRNGHGPRTDDAWADYLALGETTFDGWTAIPDPNGKKSWPAGAPNEFKVLWTSPQGNPYYILGAQYIAARLNLVNGSPDVDTGDGTISELLAEAASYLDDTDGGRLKKRDLDSEDAERMLEIAEILDDYNNGLYGGCSEDDSSGSP